MHTQREIEVPAAISGLADRLRRLGQLATHVRHRLYDNAKLRELARACGGYARIAAAHGDGMGMQRGAQACIGMGMKMAGEWPTKDKNPAMTA